MTEKQFQTAIVEYAKKQGWLIYHTYDSRRSEPGFPDLVMVRRNKVLFRELKTEKGRLTEPQKVWAAKLKKAGADYAVWRPSDLQEIFVSLF